MANKVKFSDIEVLDLFTFYGLDVLYQYHGMERGKYVYRNYDTGKRYTSLINLLVKPITVV